MTAGNKTLQDLLVPISERLGHKSVPAEVPEVDVASLEPARATDGLSHERLVDMFAEEAEKVRVSVHRCAASEAAGAVAAIVGEAGETGAANEVVFADDDMLDELGIPAALESSAAVTRATRWDAASGREEMIGRAQQARFGITRAAGAIAETGSIVQPCSAQCGRSVSLLPLVHIAVVDATTVVPTMLEAMQRLEEERAGTSGGTGSASQVCVISGPSVTSDIELVRVEGVHGPMYVHYVLVE